MTQPTQPACEVTLITPMYNESDGIARNVAQILDAMDNLPVSWEYILVDDGSKDDSLAKARELLTGRENCHVVSYAPNRGRGYALRRGFAAARGKYVITTESDLSWGAGIVGRLYDTLRETGADIAIASVHLPGGGMENVPAHRSLSGIGNRIVHWAFGGDLTMLTGMTRGYRREVLDMLHLEEDRKEIHLEIAAKAMALGLRIVEIPAVIRWEPPEPGKKGRGGRGIYRFVLSHLTLSFQHGSVKTLSVLALVSWLVGLALVVVGTLNKLWHILPYPMQWLVTYGLLIWVLSLLFGLFAMLSIQLKFVYRSMVHIQSQIKDLAGRIDRNGEAGSDKRGER
jgi:glycosyltransferase involved in cell wall biosynthesis